jgi:hypothetical protein
MKARDWWFQVVASTYRNTDNLGEINPDELESVLPDVFENLYTNIFSTKEGWLLKEGTEYTLKKLSEWRDFGGGPKIGIISNSDDRLNEILIGTN